MTYAELVNSSEKLQSELATNLRIYKTATEVEQALKNPNSAIRITVAENDREYDITSILDKNTTRGTLLQSVLKVCNLSQRNLEILVNKKPSSVAEPEGFNSRLSGNTSKQVMFIKDEEDTATKMEVEAEAKREEASEEVSAECESLPNQPKKRGRHAEYKISDKDLERAYFVEGKNGREIERESGESYWSIRRRLQEMQAEKKKTEKECASSN